MSRIKTLAKQACFDAAGLLESKQALWKANTAGERDSKQYSIDGAINICVNRMRLDGQDFPESVKTEAYRRVRYFIVKSMGEALWEFYGLQPNSWWLLQDYSDHDSVTWKDAVALLQSASTEEVP